MKVFFAHSKQVDDGILYRQWMDMKQWAWIELSGSVDPAEVVLARDDFMDFVESNHMRGVPAKVVYPAWCKHAGEDFNVYVTAETILGKATADILTRALERGCLVLAWLEDGEVARVVEVRDLQNDNWKAGYEVVLTDAKEGG